MNQSPIRGFNLINTFVFYDFPMLFSCTSNDSQKELFLAMCVDEVHDGYRWILVPLSPEKMNRVKRGNIRLRAVVLDSPMVLQVIDTATDTSKQWILPADLDELDLPGEDARLQVGPQITHRRSITAKSSDLFVKRIPIISSGSKGTNPSLWQVVAQAHKGTSGVDWSHFAGEKKLSTVVLSDRNENPTRIIYGGHEYVVVRVRKKASKPKMRLRAITQNGLEFGLEKKHDAWDVFSIARSPS